MEGIPRTLGPTGSFEGEGENNYSDRFRASAGRLTCMDAAGEERELRSASGMPLTKHDRVRYLG